MFGDFLSFTQQNVESSEFIIVEISFRQFVKFPLSSSRTDIEDLLSQQHFVDAFGCCLYWIGLKPSLKSEITETLKLARKGKPLFTLL